MEMKVINKISAMFALEGVVLYDRVTHRFTSVQILSIESAVTGKNEAVTPAKMKYIYIYIYLFYD